MESFLHHIDNAIEVGSHNVHLVDIRHSRNIVFVRLSPYGFGLRFNAALCAKYANGTVENSERSLDFDSKIDVTGRVNDIDTVSLPEASSRGGGNSNTSLLLFFHPVHRRGSLVNLSQPVRFAGVEKNSLGGRRLASVDMRHYTYIPCPFK